ncbi:MAG: NIPSNAP family protein [Reyranellaceae bacterium]
MSVDHRTCELQPGRPRERLALYEREGRLPVQMKHLGNLVGCDTTEVGNVSEIVHIWDHEDPADDRTKRCGVMAANPAWQGHLQKSGEFMKHMNNKILMSTYSSPTN